MNGLFGSSSPSELTILVFGAMRRLPVSDWTVGGQC
jgi:hypothetical protein